MAVDRCTCTHTKQHDLALRGGDTDKVTALDSVAATEPKSGGWVGGEAVRPTLGGFAGVCSFMTSAVRSTAPSTAANQQQGEHSDGSQRSRTDTTGADVGDDAPLNVTRFIVGVATSSRPLAVSMGDTALTAPATGAADDDGGRRRDLPRDPGLMGDTDLLSRSRRCGNNTQLHRR
jgi:hypothetical protein